MLFVIEYCAGEISKPDFGGDNVINMKSALYGRMRLGRCVPIGFGYTGCSNVHACMDSKCTGKQKCEIQAVNTEIKTSDGCMAGIERYLQADYESELKIM